MSPLSTQSSQPLCSTFLFPFCHTLSNKAGVSGASRIRETEIPPIQSGLRGRKCILLMFLDGRSTRNKFFARGGKGIAVFSPGRETVTSKEKQNYWQ